ncbi:MAG: bifunctional acetaldehyde-CoA/alcohol dehydrogenase [Staphylococcus epidermidis]|nr:bifunctional acetaldehyde-CoA/alcohol dehydrogenase [Staphylococcus epidermidis]
MLSVTKKNTYESNKDEVTQMIDSLAEKGQEALKELSKKSQHEINDIVHQMSMAAVDQHMHLAKLAYDETGRGIYEDKAIKNLYASEYIWNSIKDNKTVGIIGEDKQKGLTYVAEPIGVICGVTPTTNPTSTTIFKAMIAIKTGNPIIFAFHPSAQIALVLATGGSGMVKSAYSTGKPALGVGPGNVPTYIEKTAHIKRAVNDIIGSKTFDNGMICASEQVMVVDKEVYTDVVKEFKLHQTYFVNKNELQQLEDAIMNEDKTAVKPDIVGKSAVDIAKLSGISVPEKTKLLVAEIDGIGKDYPLSREKLSPVLAMVTAKSTGHALQICEDILKFGGLGHTAVIHTEDSQLQQKFGLKMKACRVLVNTPSAVGGIGNMYNELIPSLTLGCGSYGRNSISHNVSAVDLLNIKTIAKRRNNMQWFKLPPKVYFEENSVMYLTEMDNVERVMIVCDPGMVNIGYTDIVEQVLRRRENQPQIKVFNEVEPNPSTHTVYKGLEMFINFQPNTIIALGGGSAMDAAKAIWMFFEHPETSFFGAKQKFLDIRKRTYKITKPKNAKFICIPTTSGTGSEVTPFAVITDSETHVKYPLADYALTPDIAIVDPQFVLSVPKDVAADTGMDVLTHAIESYVSVMASDYTRGLSLQAIKLTFDYLKSSVQENDKHSREKMHNASTMAGMAFANAFLGISHSIAHKIGGEYGIPHGRTNAILLPHVIRYNAKDPQKHALFPKYDFFRADTDYADIAKFLGLKGNTTEELVDALANAVYDLGCSVGIDMNLKSQGVTEELLHSTIDRMAELAFEDQCTTANPKEPLISELKGIIETAYDYER